MKVTCDHEHRKNRPGLQAWNIPEGCNCDYPLVCRDENGKRVKRPKEAK